MSRPGEMQDPPQPQHLVGNRSLLEQKLELLERRFTEPLLENNHGNNNNNNNSPFGTGDSSTTTINPFSSPFGVNNHPNTSQHSFGFDTPSLSNTAFAHHSNSVGTTTITDQKNTTGAAAAAAAASSVGEGGGGLHAVEQATARHMQRLLTTAQNHHHHHHHHHHDDTRSSQAIVVAASDTSQNHILSNNSSSSRSTLVAGNKTRSGNNGTATVRGTTSRRQTRLSPLPLQESADASNNNAKKSSSSSSKNTKKRKSAVPLKIHIPSVQENLVGDDRNQQKCVLEGQQGKRSRSSTSTSDNKAGSTTPPSMFLKQKESALDTTAPSNTAATDVAATTTTTTTTAEAAAATGTTDSNGSRSSNSRTAAGGGGAAASKSKQQGRPRGSKAGNTSKSSETTTGASSSTASRDANESRNKAGKKPAKPDALISDYFLSTTFRKKTASTTSTSTAATFTATSAAAAAAAPSSTTKRKLQSKDAKPSKAGSASSKTTSPTPRRPQQPIKKNSNENLSHTKLLEELQRRVKELEDIAQDKDQQLKAVANNRTILHTALKTALNQREKELDDLAKAKSDWEARARLSMEVLVRSEAEQDAKDLQERLATDGARLGRIVQSRSNSSSGGGRRSMMNSGYVETWEEGYASRNLQSKRLELQERKAEHETRLAQAQKAAEQLKAAATDEQVKNQGGPKPTREGKDDDDAIVIVGGVPIRSLIDVRAQLESCRYHLQNISCEEKELAAEEQTLNEEKGSHIRLLKRVASEDASRFRSRPKLHDRYVLKRLLGKGGFSEVWRAFDLVDLCEVAVKIHQLDPRWSDSKKENYTKHVSREYEIHRSVRHPRIVSLLDVFEIDNHSFATVLEICDGTDLDTLLKKKRRLAERDARAILLQILSGMQYLSQPSADGSRQGIIHYDLKPGNILFDTLGDAKITDFGLSKIVDDGDSGDSMELTSQGAGTYWYLPPECFMLDENPRISNKVDVWSIGVIFYQMLFGKRPFGDGQSQDKILSDRTILNAHEVVFPDNPKISDDCKEFIKTCLSYDQAFRPTIAQLCQHPFVLPKEL